MRPVIKVENLGKRYRIGEQAAPYSTLREAIVKAARSPFSRLKRGGQEAAVWALQDVSFEVRPGEVVGVIGRNGAGKSTLLKILSRITEPTTGRVELYGRVGSLLEVGTGFHPELTGRENVFLNGAILGMRRAEIERKFDEIVAFAEIEKFLDTPVKHYSSGMYMRLAFAVAAHLEPEVLLVDEVLAVGDAAFQSKCLGKMESVAREGRTVLFVSHNLGSVANLCSRAILLVRGQKHGEGPAAEVVSEYIALGREARGEAVWDDPQSAPGNENVRLAAVRVISEGVVTNEVDIQEDVQIEIVFRNYKPGARLSTSIHLLDKMGNAVLGSVNWDSANLIRDEWFGRPHPPGLYRTVCTLPGNFLNEGRYSINAYVLADVLNMEAAAPEVVSFNVHESGGMRAEYSGPWLGVVRPKLAWQTIRVEAPEEVVAGGSAA
jgi:lipopolysaccharide transport system ATP-binding protein